MASRRETRLASHTKTAADGTFRLEGLSPGIYDLSASTPAGARGAGEVVVDDRDVADLEVTIAAPIGVEGRVTDPQGAPIAGARVSARTIGDERVSWGRSRIEVTDAQGAFRAVGLPAGALTLLAERDGVGVAAWGPDPVEPGGSRHVELRLGKGASLVGTVREADGRPAAGVTVHVLNPDQPGGRLSRATAGSDGRYELRTLLPGTARAVARRSTIPRMGPDSKALVLAAEKETTLDLGVTRTTTLRGHVRFASGKPAVGAQVLASSSPEKPGPSHPRRTLSDAQGSFAFDDVDAGRTYHVWADLPGRPGAHASAPAGTQDLALTLR
jgi:protocatechuate 3,4-dioxygenase beta subunit